MNSLVVGAYVFCVVSFQLDGRAEHARRHRKR